MMSTTIEAVEILQIVTPFSTLRSFPLMQVEQPTLLVHTAQPEMQAEQLPEATLKKPSLQVVQTELEQDAHPMPQDRQLLVKLR